MLPQLLESGAHCPEGCRSPHTAGAMRSAAHCGAFASIGREKVRERMLDQKYSERQRARARIDI